MRVFVHGVVHTMDPRRPRVEAVACEGGRIVALGRSHELAHLARRAGDVIDLRGHAVVPGFVDAHIHCLWLGQSLHEVELSDARSAKECADRVASRANAHPADLWVIGHGWNRNAWTDGRWPRADELDRATDRHPVALRSKDGHLLWVNAAALRAAGIARETPDPAGGEIVRDAHGEPTGLLKENATRLLYAAIPAPTPQQIEAALERAGNHALRLGLTGIGNFEGPEVAAAFARLRERGRLRLRVVQHIASTTLGASGLEAALDAGLRTGAGDDWLRTGHLKLFADGTLGSQTAWMLEPYTGSPHNRGIVTLSYEAMRDNAARAAAGGISTAIHAIGDGANRAALRALAAAPRVSAAPHRVEHAQLVHPDDAAMFAAHGIVASMQPIHATADRDAAERYWGSRCAHAYAWRTLQEAGATLAFGSDAPVETCDPLAGLFAAVARRDRGDAREPWRPELALSMGDAVRAYTVGAAMASGDQARKGTLARGHVADMTVLSHDIFAGSEALEQARVICTIVGGEIMAGDL